MWADKIHERARQQTDRQNQEIERREQEHRQWAGEHRDPSVPRGWTLLTDNGQGVQSYSDGDRIHYFVNGKEVEYDDYGRL